MHTYAERLFVDVATGRPLAGIRATVVDAETDAPVQPYRGGAPVALVSNGFGVVDEFQTEDTTRRVRVTVGSRSLSSWCLELPDDALAAADRAEAAAGEAATVRDGLEPRVAAVEDRQTALESAEGFGPSTPEDGQTAAFVQQSGALTHSAVRTQALDAVGARIVFTDDPSVSVPDGTLVVHYQGPRSWVEDFEDGLAGMTPRLTRRSTWASSGGAVVMPAGTGTDLSPRALSVDRLGDGESSVELLGEVSTSRLIDASSTGLIVRGQGYGAEQSGFGAALYGDGVRILRWKGGSFFVLTTIGAGTGLVAVDEKQMIRLQVGQWIEGPSERIRAKTWRAGTPEPADWQYDAGINQTSSVTGPGWAGLYSGGQYLNLTQSWHRVAVATQGETAVLA